MFDDMGRFANEMPLTSYAPSYAPNNALAGMASKQMMKPGMMKPPASTYQPMGSPYQPQMKPPGMMPPPMNPYGGSPYGPQAMAPDPMLMQQRQSALMGFGQPGPPVFGPQGMPRRFGDFRQQLRGWR